MRSAAGASALPPALQPRTTKRRSDRGKKNRRDRARKVQSLGGEESAEVMAAAWMDALEDISPSGAGGAAEDDDSYDELDELDNDKKKRGRGRSSKKNSAGVLPKRFKARSVASILLEEVNREDGVARQWLDSEARLKGRKQLPSRKFCPVTGMEGVYTEPKSGIPYANLQALEQIQERPPPWMLLSGTLAYHEAVKSIRDDEA